MKKIIAVIVLSTITALAAFTSCKHKAEMEVIRKTETLRAGAGTLELDYSFEYLTRLADDDAMRKIQAAQVADFFGPLFVRADPLASAKAFDDATFTDYQKDATDELTLNGYLTILSSSDVLDERVLAYTIERAEYMGGAHGLETTMYSNYDLRTGERLTLDDVFTPEGKTALPAAIRNAILKENGVATWEELAAKSCYWDESEVSATENFLLSKTHITFMYNPYDIACYAQGPTKVDLVLNDLVGLKKEIL